MPLSTRLRASVLLLAIVMPAQPAMSAASAGRLADGTAVAHTADFVAPVPSTGQLPVVRYPSQLARAGVQGYFEADLVVSATGEVVEVTVKRRFHRQLDKAIVDLLQQVRFRPATLDGVPVAAIYRASYDFYTK